MPWLLKFILPAAVDFILKIVLEYVLPTLVKKTDSKVDDNILETVKDEQDDIKELILEGAKKIK